MTRVDTGKRASYGHALAVDPWGEVVGDAGPDASPALVTLDLDLDKIEAIKTKMPIQQHRRQDVLRLLVDGES